MSQNYLKMDLTRVATRIALPPVARPPLYDGQDMYDHINADPNIAFLWVCTYTVSADHDIDKPIARLIHCLGKPGKVYPHIRKYTDIHTKLFLCFDGRANPRMAFVGSQNLVAATTHNLMVGLRTTADVTACLNYFNHLWTPPNRQPPTQVATQSSVQIFPTSAAPVPHSPKAITPTNSQLT